MLNPGSYESHDYAKEQERLSELIREKSDEFIGNNLDLNYLTEVILSDSKKEIIFYNQSIKILFNLKIYEYKSGIFDFSSKEFIYSENFTADLSFKIL